MKPRWAPRVSRDKIRRLYEEIARGLVDDELVDDVGFGLYARCQAILTVRDIWTLHRVPCAACGAVLSLPTDWLMESVDYLLRCDGCGWTLRWGDYWGTFRHQEL